MSLLLYPSSPNWFSSHSAALSSPLPHLGHCSLLAFASKHRIVLLSLPSHTFIDAFSLPSSTSSSPPSSASHHRSRQRIDAVAWGRSPSTLHHLIATTEDGCISVIDIRDRSLYAELRASSATPSPLAPLTCITTSCVGSEGGGVVVGGNQRGQVLRWDYERSRSEKAALPPSSLSSSPSSAPLLLHSVFDLPVTALSLSPHRADECVVGSNVGELLLVEISTGKVKQRMAGHEQQITAIDWRQPQSQLQAAARKEEDVTAERGAVGPGAEQQLLQVDGVMNGPVPPSPPSVTVVSPSSSFDSASFSSSSSTSSLDSLSLIPREPPPTAAAASHPPADTAAAAAAVSSAPDDAAAPARARRSGVKKAGRRAAGFADGASTASLDGLLLLASASKDRTVRVWNTADGSCAHVLHVSKLVGGAGKRGGGGDDDSAAQLSRVWISLAWSLSSPAALLFSTPAGELSCLHLPSSSSSRAHVSSFSSCHTRPVFDLLPSPSSPSTLFTSGMDRQVVQWDERTRKATWRAATLGGFVYALHFQHSRDDTATSASPPSSSSSSSSPSSPPPTSASSSTLLLALGMGDKSLVLWSPHHLANPYHSRCVWQGIHSKVMSLSWFPAIHPTRQSLLAYGLESGVVALLDVSKQGPDKGGGRAEVSAHQGAVYELGWRRMNREDDGEQERRQSAEAEAPSVSPSASRPPAFLLHSLGADGELVQLSLSHYSPLSTARWTRRVLRFPSLSSSSSSAVDVSKSSNRAVQKSGFAWHADGRCLAVGYSDGTVRVFAVEDEEESKGSRRVARHGDEEEEEDDDGEEEKVPSSSPSSSAVPTLSLLAEWRVHAKLVGFVKWHPSGASMAAERRRAGGSAPVSHTREGLEREVVEERQRWPYAWTLACSSDDGCISVYNCSGLVPTLAPLSSASFAALSLAPPPSPRLLRGHSAAVKNVCWSPHAQYPTHLLSSSYDCTAQVWDASTGTPLASLRGHDGRVLCCEWSPVYPGLVYSGGEDQTVRVWDIAQQKDRLPPSTQPLTSETKVEEAGKGGRPTAVSPVERSKESADSRSRRRGRDERGKRDMPLHRVRPASPESPLPSSPSELPPVVLSASASRLPRPPSSSPAMPAVPSTSSFEPDAPLHSIHLVPEPPDEPKEPATLVVSPRLAHLAAEEDRAASVQPHPQPTADEHAEEAAERAHGSRRSRGSQGKHASAAGSRASPRDLFGNLLPDTLDHASLVALARSVKAQSHRQPSTASNSPTSPLSPSSSSPLPSSSSSPSPSAAVPPLLFTCTSIASYLMGHAGHASSSHQLLPLPPFHPPRFASPLSPAASSAASAVQPSPATTHPSHGSALHSMPSLAPYHFPLWQGQLPGVLANVVATSSPLSPHLVALSASAGYDVYLQLCQLYAVQLEKEGDHHTAVLYLLNTGDVSGAIRLYLRHSLYGEAMILARARLMKEDRMVTEVYLAWAEWSSNTAEREEKASRRHRLVMQAVALHLAANEMEKALQTLVKASSLYPRPALPLPHSSALLSLSSPQSSEDVYLPLAYELACLVYPDVLVASEVFRWYGEWCQMQERWDDALEAYGMDSHWAFMTCFVLCERLAAQSLHLSIRPQSSAGAAGDRGGDGKAALPLTSLILQAWMTSSLPLQPLLKSAYSSLAPYPTFPFVSSLASSSLLFRTRANFCHHLSRSCLASMVDPAQALTHLSAAAFVLYQSSFLLSLLSFCSNSLAPRLKELKKEEKRGIYAIAQLGLLLKATRERQRWTKKELVMWGLMDFHHTNTTQLSRTANAASISPSSSNATVDGREDERDQARALELVASALLFSPPATLQSLEQRSRFIRGYMQYGAAHSAGRRRAGSAGGGAAAGDDGVSSEVLQLQRELEQCDESIRLLSHQLSVQVDGSSAMRLPIFPSPLESAALLVLYALRFCPSVAAASPLLHSSSPLFALMAHIQRWLRSTCEYAVKGLGEEGERWIPAQVKEGEAIDMAALMDFAWAMAERVPRDVTWEKLRAFVHA